MKKLRIGVILNGANIPAWLVGMLNDVRNAGNAKLIVLAFVQENLLETQDLPNPLNIGGDTLQLGQMEPNAQAGAWVPTDIKKVFPDVPSLDGDPNKWNFLLKFADLDLFLNFSDGQPPDVLLRATRYGIWTLLTKDCALTASLSTSQVNQWLDGPATLFSVEIQREHRVQYVQRTLISPTQESVFEKTDNLLQNATRLVPQALNQFCIHGADTFFDGSDEKLQKSDTEPKQTLDLNWSQLV